ncbi:hypothetical protein [Streptomyces sp. OP7]
MAGKNASAHKDCEHESTKAARAKCRRWRKMLRDILNGEAGEL